MKSNDILEYCTSNLDDTVLVERIPKCPDAGGIVDIDYDFTEIEKS